MPYCMYVKYRNEEKRRENPVVMYRAVGLGAELGLFFKTDKTIEDILVRFVSRKEMKKMISAALGEVEK